MPSRNKFGTGCSSAWQNSFLFSFAIILNTNESNFSPQGLCKAEIPCGEKRTNVNSNLPDHFPDAENDLSVSTYFRTVANLRNEVTDRMVDFAMASEHFAYQYMRVFYNNAKQAQAVNTPGADTVVNALSPLFEGQGGQPPVVPNP